MKPIPKASVDKKAEAFFLYPMRGRYNPCRHPRPAGRDARRRKCIHNGRKLRRPDPHPNPAAFTKRHRRNSPESGRDFRGLRHRKSRPLLRCHCRVKEGTVCLSAAVAVFWRQNSRRVLGPGTYSALPAALTSKIFTVPLPHPPQIAAL